MKRYRMSSYVSTKYRSHVQSHIIIWLLTLVFSVASSYRNVAVGISQTSMLLCMGGSIGLRWGCDIKMYGITGSFDCKSEKSNRTYLLKFICVPRRLNGGITVPLWSIAGVVSFILLSRAKCNKDNHSTCVVCGYSLVGLNNMICPECGYTNTGI